MMLRKGSWNLSKRNYRNLLRPLAYLLVPIVLIFFLSSLKLKNITCEDRGSPCSVEITNTLNRYLGTSILSLKKQSLLQDLNKIQPTKDIFLHYQSLNSIKIDLESEQRSIPINLSLVIDYPSLSFNQLPISSESAVFFQKPSTEIGSSVGGLVFTSFNLWYNGEISSSATQSSKILFLSKQKPSKEDLVAIFNLLETADKYLKVDNIYILGNVIFLSAAGQPDIITSVPYDGRSLTEALQSLGFLTTMKKDPKIIDLRYKNPIIR